jgi:TRAP-type C4-dicarboxylate transport system permease large subunit
MFILLVETVFHSGMAMCCIDVVDKWMWRLPDRLGLLAVAVKITVRISGMIFLILSGVKAFSQFMVYTQANVSLVAWVMNLPLIPILVIIGTMFIVLIMGMFMSGPPIMIITLPIFMPIISALGFNPVWFGLLFLVNIEMGCITPPFGILLFVMKGVAPQDTTMADIIKAGIPFLICYAVCMALVMAFPVLATWLPGLMHK